MRQTTYDWGNHNILDDIDYNEEDAKQFKALLDNKVDSEESIYLNAGQLISGTIVEINKEFAVIDVGLKSEGLVPVSEFSASAELKLNKKIEYNLFNFDNLNYAIIYN
jgi:small subunit ribosomal protein S1